MFIAIAACIILFFRFAYSAACVCSNKSAIQSDAVFTIFDLERNGQASGQAKRQAGRAKGYAEGEQAGNFVDDEEIEGKADLQGQKERGTGYLLGPGGGCSPPGQSTVGPQAGQRGHSSGLLGSYDARASREALLSSPARRGRRVQWVLKAASYGCRPSEQSPVSLTLWRQGVEGGMGFNGKAGSERHRRC